MVTENKIVSWIFSEYAPSEAVNGMVWIQTGTSSDAEFDALKKNCMAVYPVKCRQYLSGAWELRIAYIYKSGSWVQFSTLATYLYQAPEGAVVPFVSSKESNATVTIGSDAIITGYSSTSNGISAVRTQNTVDLTEFNVLCVRAKTTAMRTDTTTYTPVACISTTAFTQSSRKTAFQATVDMTADSVEKVYTIDISAITGSYYVGCWGIHKSQIYEIYLTE